MARIKMVKYQLMSINFPYPFLLLENEEEVFKRDDDDAMVLDMKVQDIRVSCILLFSIFYKQLFLFVCFICEVIVLCECNLFVGANI